MTTSSEEPDTGKRLKALEDALYNLQRERQPSASTLDNCKTGTVAGFLTSNTPQGWILLGGQTITAAEWPALASYLTANSLSLTLPDYRDRFVVGAGFTYTSTSTGGAADAIAVSHTHTGPSHTHGTNVKATNTELAGEGTASSGNFVNRLRVDGSGDTSAAGGTGSTGSAGSSGTGANLPPYRGLYWMIRT